MAEAQADAVEENPNCRSSSPSINHTMNTLTNQFSCFALAEKIPYQRCAPKHSERPASAHTLTLILLLLLQLLLLWLILRPFSDLIWILIWIFFASPRAHTHVLA